MNVNFFQRRKILLKSNYLDLIPVKLHKHTENEQGKVILLIPKFKNEKLGTFFLGRRSKNFNIKLDEFGSATWLEIDGKKNVGEICETLIEKYGNAIHPVEKRVTGFLTKLYENRYISFSEIQKK